MSRAKPPKPAKAVKSGAQGKERRSAFRRQATFPVDIIRVNQFRFKQKWDHEVGVNIGAAGVCLRSGKALPEKASVTLALLLHNEDAELVEVDARLVWTRPRVERQEKLYYMGLEFTKVGDDAQRLIQHFVDATR